MIATTQLREITTFLKVTRSFLVKVSYKREKDSKGLDINIGQSLSSRIRTTVARKVERHHWEAQGGKVRYKMCGAEGYPVLWDEERAVHAWQNPREPYDPIKVFAEQVHKVKEAWSAPRTLTRKKTVIHTKYSIVLECWRLCHATRLLPHGDSGSVPLLALDKMVKLGNKERLKWGCMCSS